jgi:hypothetical protein
MAIIRGDHQFTFLARERSDGGDIRIDERREKLS